MDLNLQALWKWARRLCALVAVVSLITAMGCGEGAGGGAEDTGSILLIRVTSIDRNVDIAPDDTTVPPDGVIDHFLSDQTISMSFTNRSVVPGIARPGTTTEAKTDTDTFIRVVSYTIDYSTSDPTAPALESREFFTEFWDGLVSPEEAVERNDIMLVPLATIYEFDDKVFSGAVPTDAVPEYVAHYTFHAETARFGESMTAEASVSFSFGDFVP